MFKRIKILKVGCYFLIFLFLFTGGMTGFFYYHYLSLKQGHAIKIEQLIKEADHHDVREKRTYIPYDQIPTSIINAYLTEYEPKFFLKGCSSTFYDNLKAKMEKKNTAAGSIYYQFSKLIIWNSSPTPLRGQDFHLVTFGVSIESCFKFSKEKVLEFNLNNNYFGREAYGIFDAAKAYYGRHLKDIDLDDAVVLIALLKAPTSLNKDYEKLKRYRNRILEKMLILGFIDNSQSIQLKNNNIDFVKSISQN